MDIQLTINGEQQQVAAAKADSLLDVLRKHGFTGTNRACDTGACGMCRVLLDGEPIESCAIPATRAEGREVETIEGIGTQDDLHPIQEAFVEHSAVQCGYCTPGMVLTSKAFLRENSDPTETEVREALDDVLCRCTGYKKIVDAVLDAAERMQAESVAADGGVAGSMPAPQTKDIGGEQQ